MCISVPCCCGNCRSYLFTTSSSCTYIKTMGGSQYRSPSRFTAKVFLAVAVIIVLVSLLPTSWSTDMKTMGGNPFTSPLKSHKRRVRRMVGLQMKCFPEMKKFCYRSQNGHIRKMFCIMVKVKRCTSLDK